MVTLCIKNKINLRGGNGMQNIYYDPSVHKENNMRRWFQNVKLVGELDDGTSIYIEDYAYTYISQYKGDNLSCEYSAVLIGKYYEQANQVVISGVIPIDLDMIDPDVKWISKDVLEEIKIERELYFPSEEYVGWMHTQPGYGIMATTQELSIHEELFGEKGVLLLTDPINNVKTFFEFKDSQLIKKQGFCIYYEKNEAMQRYMMDYPLAIQEKEEISDSAVASFREMGVRRQRELLRKKQNNRIVAMAAVTLLLAGAFITGIYEQQRKINRLEKDVVDIHQQYNEMEYQKNESPVELVFTSVEQIADVEMVEEQIKEKTKEEVQDIPLQQGYEVYSVKNGDSLLNISYRYYNTPKMAKEIAKLNEIEDLDAIYVGQKLKLPRVGE